MSDGFAPDLMILVKIEVPKESFGNSEFLLLTQLTEFNLPVFFFDSQQASLFSEVFQPPTDQETVVTVCRPADDDGQMWIHTGAPEGARDFVAAVLKGGVPPYVKSEERPMDNSGAVKKIVGSNYNEIVRESGLLCVILLYGSENYALQVQMERLNEAAREMQGKAIFGVLNVEKNEVPLTVPAELPTVVAVGKEWVKTYGRDVGVGIAEWVQELLNSEL
jgi:hypothetical protein